MIAEGLRDRQYSIEGKMDRLLEASENLPWLEEIIFWLIENRPSGSETRSICHGDFHPHNLLAKDGDVTAILDWSSCRIGDPAADVASTMVIFSAATKHIVQSFDAKIEIKKYLDAYRRVRDLNEQHLGYYQVFGCLLRLFAGGFIWAKPAIRNELIHIIYEFTKIHVEVPS